MEILLVDLANVGCLNLKECSNLAAHSRNAFVTHMPDTKNKWGIIQSVRVLCATPL